MTVADATKLATTSFTPAGNEADRIQRRERLFMSRVRAKDGSRRAISREHAWRLVKTIARENDMPQGISTHSSRKTLARAAMEWSKDIRVVQKILGHASISSTEHYLASLSEREVWQQFLTRQPAA